MIRTITLSDSEGAPTIMAECTDQGWNGFHVPYLTGQEFADHIQALRANDPNGTWDEVHVAFTSDAIQMSTDEYRNDDGTFGPDGIDTWLIDPKTGRAPIDGLVWSDPA